ncbi:MAG TPA: F0F1 ATP synthase subunit B [Steroidobacteraceae bacterium]|nr:F0F1 ATP synthase subunit B [Steroidobacteraceae bacterium]
MNINLTLIVQMLVFVVLTLFTMKKIWPHILGVMDERSKKIALGLAAAEKGQEQLKQAHQEAEVILREARERAQKIIDQAHQRGNEAIEQAKGTATSEGQRLVAAAHQQITLESTRAREGLRHEVAQLAVQAAAKLLEREIDPRAHADLIDKLAAQI